MFGIDKRPSLEDHFTQNPFLSRNGNLIWNTFNKMKVTFKFLHLADNTIPPDNDGLSKISHFHNLLQ